MSEAADIAKHDLAANLRIFRAYHQMTLQEVADRAGLCADTVSELEREKGNPRVRTVARLAYAFNVDAGTLLRSVQFPEVGGDDE